MFRPMRRTKRAISDEDVKRLLEQGRRAVLAVNGDDGYPCVSAAVFGARLGSPLFVVGAVMCGGQALTVLARLAQMSSLALVIAWLACMCAMGYFAGHRDQGSARDNWTEQLTNNAGQACPLAALLLA